MQIDMQMHRIPAIKGSLQVQYFSTSHTRNSSLPNYESTLTSPRQEFSHPSPRKHITKPSALNPSYKSKQPPPLVKTPSSDTGTIMFKSFTPTYSGSEMFSPQSITRQISVSRREVLTPKTATPFLPHAKQMMVHEKGFLMKEKNPLLSNLAAAAQTDTTLTEQSLRTSPAKAGLEDFLLGDKNEYNLTIETEEKPLTANLGLKTRFQKIYENHHQNKAPLSLNNNNDAPIAKEATSAEKKRIKMKGSLSLTTGVFFKNNDTNAHLNKVNTTNPSTKRKVLLTKKPVAAAENRPMSICSARIPMEIGINLGSANSVHLKSSSIPSSPKNDTLLLKSISLRDTIVQNGNFTEENALKQMQRPSQISFSPRVSVLTMGTPKNKGSIRVINERDGSPRSKVNNNTPSRRGWKKGGKSPWRRNQSISWNKVGSTVYTPNINEIDEDKVYQVDHQSIYKGGSIKGITRLHVVPKETEEVMKEIKKVEVQFEQQYNIGKNNARVNTDEELDIFNIDKKRLNMLDMKVIVEEYNKKISLESDVDYDRVDKITKNLKFFSTLDKITRLKLLKCSTYHNYKFGEIIFKQGDYGDLMYIILKGAVNIRVSRRTPYGTTEEATIGRLYDGAHFGEYSMMGTAEPYHKKTHSHHPLPHKSNNNTPLIKHQMKHFNFESGQQDSDRTQISSGSGLLSPEFNWKNGNMSTLTSQQKAELEMMEYQIDSALIDSQPEFDSAKGLAIDSRNRGYRERSLRAATIEVSETCDVLAIPRKQYQFIFLNLLQKDLDQKLQALLHIPFLADLDPFALLPVANNLVHKVYNYGEIILGAGDTVDKFRIIGSGKCKLLFGHLNTAPAETGVAKGLNPSEEHFNVGLPDYSCNNTKHRDSSISKATKEVKKSQEIWTNSKRSFHYDKIRVEGGNMVYLEHMPLGSLIRGTYFGGRSLLTDEDFAKDEGEYRKKTLELGPARVSVVSDGAKVEIFELDKERFEYIPDFLAKILKDGLKQQKEFDDFDIAKEIAMAEEWKIIKERELKELDRTTGGALIKKFKKL